MFEAEDFATCCGDVRELLYYKGSLREHTWSLCKTLVLEDTDRSNSDKWVYMIITKGDKYPIIITEECAKSILEDPEKGNTLTFCRHFDRYR